MEMMLEHEPVDTRLSARDDVAPDDGVDRPYSKPTLTPLGRWNLFTRQASAETQDGGFFEFDVGP